MRKNLQKGANAKYWIKKIQSNRARDTLNTTVLKGMGWYVVRLWESEILSDVEAAAALICSKIARQNR